MTTTVLDRPVAVPSAGGDGGLPARRAVVRWAWRLFRREWRQQLLILALVIVAVAATVVGATVATTTQAPADLGFGTAQDLVAVHGSPQHVDAEIARIHHSFGPVDAIWNQTATVPGSTETYQLRAQDPHGPYGGPLLQLLSGRYPTGAGQVALTPDLATTLHVGVGDVVHLGGAPRTVIGLVQNPLSLLDEFALVAPGQVAAPTQVTVLFDAAGAPAKSLAALGHQVQTRSAAGSGNAFNPETIVLGLATVGLLLIALVAVGGFTVLAQRRLRSIGMLGALGATDRNLSLVVRANGVVVGVVGSIGGFVLGLVAWLLYRPHAESSSHHVIGVWALPWTVVVVAMVLAVLATYFAAIWPARAVARMPVVAALAGRPAPPRKIRRSAVPGIIVLGVAFALLAYAGGRGGGGGSGEVVLGLVALVAAVVLLSPTVLSILPKVGRRAPVAVRLALRDLARYRARSGSALAAISLGVLIAVIICVLAAARYGNVLDYAGPNLASNQLIVYASTQTARPDTGPPPPGTTTGPSAGTAAGTVTQPSLATAHARAEAIAKGLGSHEMVQLDTVEANLVHAAAGRQFSGQIYVGTPQLLAAFGITPAQVDPNADVLTMRPGLSGVADLHLQYGQGTVHKFIGPGTGPGTGPGPGTRPTTAQYTCPKGSCLANPVIQEVGALPAGTSAPNTVVTEHAVHQLGLHTSPDGWFIQTAQPLTAAQISNARQAAAADHMSIETKSDAPSSTEVINWATVFGMALALGILAMTVGLIRSETAGDLRILTATGASTFTRRSLTAATAGALALLGAVVGTVAGYVACIAYSSSSNLDGLSELGNIPLRNLLLLVVGMPLVAVVVGWVFAGRQPPAIAQRPLE